MKGFFKDYVGLWKATGDFYKKHWFGVIVMNVITFAGTMAWYERDEIKDLLDSKFHKQKEDEA